MPTIRIGAGQQPTPRNDLIFGTPGDDIIVDPGGNDLIFAHDGNDQIAAGPGFDGIDGGGGTDTAQLVGLFADYRITSGSLQGITGTIVDDLRLGNADKDGIDAYARVERLAFLDGTHYLVPNAGPTAPTLDGATVAENDPGAVVGVLAATDPDGDPLVYSVSDDRFEVVLVAGVATLRLKPGTSLDHEAEPEVSLTVTVTDAPPAEVGGAVPAASASAAFTVAVTDVPETALDFVAANEHSASVSVRLGDGAGGFAGTTEVAVGSYPRSVALGELDGPAPLTPSGLPDSGPLVPLPADPDFLV